jgi:membrane fusion protein (multidrug efflux system)
LRLKRELASGQLKGVADNAAPVKLTLDDGATYEQPGKMEFSEVTVDQATGSVILRAIFPNDKGQLLPGMFVEETIEEGIRENAILAPQRGVTHDAKGDAMALVIGADGKVAQRMVVTDRAIGNDWLVLSGLGEGDRLIVDSLQMVKPGDEATAKEVPAEIGQATP